MKNMTLPSERIDKSLLKRLVFGGIRGVQKPDFDGLRVLMEDIQPGKLLDWDALHLRSKTLNLKDLKWKIKKVMVEFSIYRVDESEFQKQITTVLPFTISYWQALRLCKVIDWDGIKLLFPEKKSVKPVEVDLNLTVSPVKPIVWPTKSGNTVGETLFSKLQKFKVRSKVTEPEPQQQLISNEVNNFSEKVPEDILPAKYDPYFPTNIDQGYAENNNFNYYNSIINLDDVKNGGREKLENFEEKTNSLNPNLIKEIYYNEGNVRNSTPQPLDGIPFDRRQELEESLSFTENFNYLLNQFKSRKKSRKKFEFFLWLKEESNWIVDKIVLDGEEFDAPIPSYIKEKLIILYNYMEHGEVVKYDDLKKSSRIELRKSGHRISLKLHGITLDTIQSYPAEKIQILNLIDTKEKNALLNILVEPPPRKFMKYVHLVLVVGILLMTLHDKLSHLTPKLLEIIQKT